MIIYQRADILLQIDLQDLNDNTTADVGDIVYTTEDQKPFDNYFGVNLYNVINKDTKNKL